MTIKKIDWESKQNDNIEHIYGKINGIIMFNIVRFKTDPYIMTSHTIPMVMKKGDDIKKLQKEAVEELTAFVKSITLKNYKNVIRGSRKRTR